jgi:hypothetical protein
MSSPSNSEPVKPTFGEAFARMKDLLDPLSNKDRTSMLKALCGLYGMKATYGPIIPSSAPPIRRGPIRSQQSKPGSNPKKADPRVKELRSEIQKANILIKEKSVLLGSPLPETDPLIVGRSNLFRDLKEAQNKPASQASPSSPKGKGANGASSSNKVAGSKKGLSPN